MNLSHNLMREFRFAQFRSSKIDDEIKFLFDVIGIRNSGHGAPLKLASSDVIAYVSTSMAYEQIYIF